MSLRKGIGFCQQSEDLLLEVIITCNVIWFKNLKTFCFCIFRIYVGMKSKFEESYS